MNRSRKFPQNESTETLDGSIRGLREFGVYEAS